MKPGDETYRLRLAAAVRPATKASSYSAEGANSLARSAGGGRLIERLRGPRGVREPAVEHGVGARRRLETTVRPCVARVGADLEAIVAPYEVPSSAT